jgi:hypothetical protein
VGQASDSRPDPFDARAGPGHPIGWLVPYWDDPAGPAPKSVSIASSLSSHHICWRKCTEQAWYATSTLLIFLVMLRIRDDIFLANIPASEASTAGQDQAHLVGCFSSPARLIFAHGLTIEFHVPPASRPSVFATWSCLGAPDQCALPPPDLDSARSCLISNFGGLYAKPTYRRGCRFMQGRFAEQLHNHCPSSPLPSGSSSCLFSIGTDNKKTKITCISG